MTLHRARQILNAARDGKPSANRIRIRLALIATGDIARRGKAPPQPMCWPLRGPYVLREAA